MNLLYKFTKFNLMVNKVREPIQVYLTEDERAELDRLARALGVSRSEILRRGVTALKEERGNAGSLPDLVAEGHVTPPRAKAGQVVRGTPVAPLTEILDELSADRDDR